MPSDDTKAAVVSKRPRRVDSIPEQFLVLVTCRNETQQVELLQRFHSEGIQFNVGGNNSPEHDPA